MRFAGIVVITSLAACAADVDGGDAAAGSTLGGDNGGDDGGKADSFGFSGRICAAGPTTRGIDVSYYQGTIDWTGVAKSGIAFAYMRLSDGDVFRDPKFDANWSNAAAAGVIRGAYQFFRPNQSVDEQADMMIGAMQTLQSGDLPPMIDVEATGGLSASNVATKVSAWVDKVQSAVGVTPIVYSGSYFWRDDVGGSKTEATDPFWIAQYTTKCPNLPLPWHDWAMWQYSSHGAVTGIRGAVDLDQFNGSIDDLRAFAIP